MMLSRQRKYISQDTLHRHEHAVRLGSWEPLPRVCVTVIGCGSHRHACAVVNHPKPMLSRSATFEGAPDPEPMLCVEQMCVEQMEDARGAAATYERGYALDVKSAEDSDIFVRVAPSRGGLAEVQSAVDRASCPGFRDEEVAALYAADRMGLRASDLVDW